MGRQPKRPEKSAIARNLKAARQAAGFETASDAARFMGMSIATVIANEGSGTSFRKPKLENLRIYAKAYNVTIDALEGGTVIGSTESPARPGRDLPTFDNLVSAPILGTAQAGHWLEDDPIAADARREVAHTKPGREPLFAIRVAGDSMNRIIQDGDIAVVKPWRSLKRDVRNNEVVLVQRERGGRYELTIKTHRDGQLWPESTNPKWRHPIPMRDGDVITVVGLVVGLYRSL